MPAAAFVLSTLPFLPVELFPSWLYITIDIAAYLVFHNIAEFFSVMVSLSIFGVGWYTYDKSVFGTLTVLGHICKVPAFYLVYRGIFVVSVRNPYLICTFLENPFTSPNLIETRLFLSPEGHKTMAYADQKMLIKTRITKG